MQTCIHTEPRAFSFSEYIQDVCRPSIVVIVSSDWRAYPGKPCQNILHQLIQLYYSIHKKSACFARTFSSRAARYARKNERT